MKYRLKKKFFFAYEFLLVLNPLVEKTILYPLNCFCTFVENQMTAYVWICFWTLFCFIGLSLCWLYTYCLCCHSFVVNLKSESLSSPTLFFFQSCFGYLSCPLPYELYHWLINWYQKKPAGILIGNAMTWKISLREINIFNNIESVTCEHICPFIKILLNLSSVL